jgi:HupE / UreJ protein
MIRICALAALCIVAAGGAALADIRSFSYSIWDVLGSTVHLRFIMPTAEARHLVDPGSPAPPIAKVREYVGDHVAVSAGGANCPPIDQGEEVGLINTLSLTPGWYRFEVIFQCASPKDIVLQDTAFFGVAPEHINFARVQVDGGGFAERLFTPGKERISASSDGGIFGDCCILRYLRIGFAHVLASVDRLIFVLGLVFLVRRPRDYGLVVAGLSVGYLASMAISATDIVAPRMQLVEALMAFMSVFIAAQIIVLTWRRPQFVAIIVGLGCLVIAMSSSMLDTSGRLLLFGFGLFAACYLLVCDRIADRAIFWLLPSALFAFMDGFGLAAAVSGLDVPARQLVPMLAGFDLGAVLADLLVLTVITAGVILLRRTRFAVPRPIAVDLGTAILVCLGVSLFVSRAFS